MLISIISTFTLKSQIPSPEIGNLNYLNVDELCYITSTVEKIRITSDVNIETLTNMEKVKFSPVEYRKKHHLYFENGKYFHDISYYYQENKFPKWYKAADKISISNEGIRSYYFEYSSYYTNGWPGSGKDTVQFGIYKSDPRTGERYYIENHSNQSKIAYNNKNYYFNEYGFLYGKVFYVPNASYFQQLISMGYTVTSTTNLIIISNQDNTITWDLNEKTIKKEIFENGNLKFIIITKYIYYPEFQTYLRSEITEITPEYFENGDCYETVVNTVFTDYDMECTGVIDFHSADSKDEIFTFTLDPNPVKDELNVTFENSKYEKSVEIISINGDVLQSYIFDQKTTTAKLNLEGLTSGMYFLRVISNGKNLSEKFIKL